MQKDRIISFEEMSGYGYRHCHRTGESIVFFNPEKKLVHKYKNPFAKAPLKNVPSEDVPREYLVHNAIFPETPYTLEGINYENGELRQILSQRFVPSVKRPSKEQIGKALLERGLHQEGRYAYGNEYVTVLDVEGDNTLVGEDGLLYFIDPIIGFKAPIDDILEHYTEIHIPSQTPFQEKQTFISRLRKFFTSSSGNPAHFDLTEILMEDGSGMTAADWLLKQSEKWRFAHENAIVECIQGKIPLHQMNIEYIARERQKLR